MRGTPGTQVSLLIRLRDTRDGAAWSRFVDVYGPLVYGFLKRGGLQEADVADLTQDVLTQVSQAIKTLEYDRLSCPTSRPEPAQRADSDSGRMLKEFRHAG